MNGFPSRDQPLLLGIHGRKRSGKNEAAKAVQELTDGLYSYAENAYAWKLKHWLCSLFFPGCTLEEAIEFCEDIKDIRKTIDLRHVLSTAPAAGFPVTEVSITGRQLMQHGGNEARTVFGEDFWLDQLFPLHKDQSRGYYTPYHHWHRRSFNLAAVCVVTDLRYENEIQRVKDCGGKVILIRRPGNESDGAPSEQEYPALCDDVIENNSSIGDLHNKVKNFVNTWIEEAP